MGQETGLETGSQVEKKVLRNNPNVLTTKYPKQEKVFKGLTVSNGGSQPGAMLPTRGILEVLKIFLIVTAEGGWLLASGRWKPNMLLNAQHCKGPPHRAESRCPRLEVPVSTVNKLRGGRVWSRITKSDVREPVYKVTGFFVVRLSVIQLS